MGKTAIHIKTLSRLIIAIGIFAFALIVIGFRTKQSSQNIKLELSAWPNFSGVDIAGRPIIGNKYINRIRYVQFVGMIDDNNINLLDNVYNNWANKIEIFIITRNNYNYRNLFVDHYTKANIILDKYDELTKIFNATKYGKHYLFHKNGKILFASDNNVEYEAGIKKYLQFAVDNIIFRVSEMIKEKSNVIDLPEYSQISQIVKNGRKYLLVGMLSSFCDSCATSQLLNIMRKMHIDYGWENNILLILSGKYTNRDAEIIKTQLNINFPVIIANEQLNSKWLNIIKLYSKSDASNFAFTIDEAGNIDRVLDPLCQTCEKRFWDSIRKRYSNREII